MIRDYDHSQDWVPTQFLTMAVPPINPGAPR
jgi:hypothetical protein